MSVMRPSRHALLALCLLAGCATPPPYPGESAKVVVERNASSTAASTLRLASPLDKPGAPPSIAIIVTPPPGAEVRDPLRSQDSGIGSQRGQDALRGAAHGALVGAGATLAIAPLALLAGPFGLPILLGALAGSVAIGATGGALSGTAITGPSAADQAREFTRWTLQEVDTAALPACIARHIEATIAATTGLRAVSLSDGAGSAGAAHGAHALRSQGHAAIIDVKGPEVRFMARPDRANPLALVVTADAQLIDTEDGRVTDLRGIVIELPPRTGAEWTHDQAALAKREIGRACQRIAESVVERFVLAVDSAHPGEGKEFCGPAPREPKPAARGSAVQLVDSLTPSLAWASSAESPANAGVPADSQGVRYDLRVWKFVGDLPEDLVVERFGLEESRYRLDAPLEPSTVYGWTVRARYMLDGRARAGQWSAADPSDLPLQALTGMPYRGRLVGDKLVREPCAYAQLTACRCLDFIPAFSMWQFRTPAQ